MNPETVLAALQLDAMYAHFQHLWIIVKGYKINQKKGITDNTAYTQKKKEIFQRRYEEEEKKQISLVDLG